MTKWPLTRLRYTILPNGAKPGAALQTLLLINDLLGDGILIFFCKFLSLVLQKLVYKKKVKLCLNKMLWWNSYLPVKPQTTPSNIRPVNIPKAFMQLHNIFDWNILRYFRNTMTNPNIIGFLIKTIFLNVPVWSSVRGWLEVGTGINFWKE